MQIWFASGGTSWETMGNLSSKDTFWFLNEPNCGVYKTLEGAKAATEAEIRDYKQWEEDMTAEDEERDPIPMILAFDWFPTFGNEGEITGCALWDEDSKCPWFIRPGILQD